MSFISFVDVIVSNPTEYTTLHRTATYPRTAKAQWFFSCGLPQAVGLHAITGSPALSHIRIVIWLGTPNCQSTSAVSVFIFNPFFFHFYCLTRSTVLTFSRSLPMLPYVILTISMCFPIEWTLTFFSFSLPSRPFTRYQEQDLLVASFGLLRTIPTIPAISLPPPDLPYALSRGSRQTCEYLTSYLEMADSLLPHLDSRPYR